MEYTIYRAMGAATQFDGAVFWNNTQFVFLTIIEGDEVKYESISEVVEGKPFPVDTDASSQVSKMIRQNIHELKLNA